MKIALLGKKGGTGKSSICLLLHEALRQTGQTVAVRDYDAQGTATKALQRFGGTRAQDGQAYDQLLIDTPPSLTFKAAEAPAAIAAAAAREANVILIPTSPSPADIWEADETARFARTKNSSAAIRIVLNRVRAGTLLTGAIEETLKGTAEPVLQVGLADRQSYQHALLKGWAALDPKAVTEVLQFTVAVTSLIRL
jgi:chromosome partitioning protein